MSAFLVFSFGLIFKKVLLKTGSKSFPAISSGSFIVPGLVSMSSLHFELILECVLELGSSAILCRWISTFPDTTGRRHWRCFPVVTLGPLVKDQLTVFAGTYVCLHPLFCSVDPCVCLYARAILF